MNRETERPIRSLMPVPDLPTCPHCGSKHVKTFSLDWIEVPEGSWECVDCGSAFIPEAWVRQELQRLRELNTGLTKDFNSMLVEQSKQRNRAEAAEAELRQNRETSPADGQKSHKEKLADYRKRKLERLYGDDEPDGGGAK